MKCSMTYETKDSGERVTYESGFNRDVAHNKPRYDLIPPSSLKRLAEVYMRGSQKYGDSNWKLATSEEEHQRFIASAFRHFEQWRNGEQDEDHAYQAIWNIIAYEWHKDNQSVENQ